MRVTGISLGLPQCPKCRSKIDKNPTFFARISGKVVECTERNTEKRPAGAFDDYVYLGQGVYIGNKATVSAAQ